MEFENDPIADLTTKKMYELHKNLEPHNVKFSGSVYNRIFEAFYKIIKAESNEELIEKLELKFDEYHKKQLETKKLNVNHYLFMGKASAIVECVEMLQKKQLK